MSRAMISLALLVSLALVPTRQFPVLGRGIPMAASGGGGSPGLLSSANLTCTGVQLSHVSTVAGSSTNYPMTLDPNNGHFYEVTGDGKLEEQAPATWSACSTAVGSMNSMTLVTAWGSITTGGTDSLANCSNTPCYIYGISESDSATKQFVISWAAQYSNVPTGANSFAVVHLSGGVVNTDGCYGIDNTGGYGNQPIWGTGSLPIPSSFQTAYSAHLSGANYMLGFGGYEASTGGGVSLGPSANAIVLPTAGNTCLSTADHTIGPGLPMAVFKTTAGGPTCDPVGPPAEPMNCDYSAGTITHPIPAFLASTSYRYNVYPDTWNPVPYASPTHGFVGLEMGVMGWYDDGSSGTVGTMLAAFDSPDCWAQTTVTGGVSGSYPTWNATIGSTSCHSAALANLRVGDLIYVQTCVAGVDAGCASANANDYSLVALTAVNTSTGAISYSFTDSLSRTERDSSTNCSGTPGSTCGQPITSANVVAGAVYYHAATRKTRAYLHLQFIDPAQYGNVLAGSALIDSPTYTTDADLAAMGVAFQGSNPIPDYNSGDSGGGYRPVSIIPDPAHSLIYIVCRNAVGSPEQNVVYRFAVTH